MNNRREKTASTTWGRVRLTPEEKAALQACISEALPDESAVLRRGVELVQKENRKARRK